VTGETRPQKRGAPGKTKPGRKNRTPKRGKTECVPKVSSNSTKNKKTGPKTQPWRGKKKKKQKQQTKTTLGKGGKVSHENQKPAFVDNKVQREKKKKKVGGRKMNTPKKKKKDDSKTTKKGGNSKGTKVPGGV